VRKGEDLFERERIGEREKCERYLFEKERKGEITLRQSEE